MPKSSFTRLVAAMLVLYALALFAQTPISVNPWRKTVTGVTTSGTVNMGSATLNSAAGSKVDLNFSSGGTLKWQWDKNTDDSFALWDAAGSRNALKFTGSGNWASFYGAVQLGGTAQPSCTSGNAGIMWYSGHSTGVKDSAAICAADAANAYGWRTIY